MTKRIILGAVILMFGMVSSLSAGNYNIPSGYTYIKSVGGGALKVYHKNGVYVSVIDLSKAKLNVGNVEEASGNRFVKYSLSNWWNNEATSKTLGMYNGQFFSMSWSDYLSPTTTLSFPLRSYWRTINSSVDSGYLRTLRVNSSGSTTIHYGYSNNWFMTSAKELIVGLSPYELKSPYNSTGRFYIGGIPYNSSIANSYSRTMKNLLFFTGVSKTQSQMFNVIADWNVMSRDIVMMDGSGSAQMKVGSLSVYANGQPVRRNLPNVITIEKK